jgi:hypothetical protein
MKTHLYFGNYIESKTQESLVKYSIESGKSINHVLIKDFDSLISKLQTTKDKLNYFDLRFSELFDENVVSPNFSSDSYNHSSPTLVFDIDSVVENEFLSSLSIPNEIFEKIGKLFENDFYFEFLGFKRVS